MHSKLNLDKSLTNGCLTKFSHKMSKQTHLKTNLKIQLFFGFIKINDKIIFSIFFELKAF